MKTLASLRLVPVWLNRQHMVGTARIVMEGHGLRALGIVDESRQLDGIVTLESTLTADQQAEVGTLLKPATIVLDPNTSTREVVDQFIENKVDFAPLVDNGIFRAMITSSMLLERMRQSWDPRTELPWSDALRTWGAEQLKESTEIAILFLDLNDFGIFNKRYGHVIGDRVLKRFADFLLSCTDSEQDIVVRFGGDEFAVGTRRDRDDADNLAATLLERGKTLTIPEIEETIHFAVGVHGGRRSKERLNVHFGATLDNLINLASQDCLLQKKKNQTGHSQVVAEPVNMDLDSAGQSYLPTDADRATSLVSNTQTQEAEPLTEAEQDSGVFYPSPAKINSEPEGPTGFLVLESDDSADSTTPKDPANESRTDLHLEANESAKATDEKSSGWPTVLAVQVEESPNSLTHVAIRADQGVFFGVGVRMGRTLYDSIAYATGKALEKAYSGHTINVDAVKVVESTGTESVQVEARVSDGYLERKVVAEVEFDEDKNSSVALATIGAFFAE